MQFGDDWPGVFIRGDNALHYAMALQMALEHPEQIKANPIMLGAPLRGLLRVLSGCRVTCMEPTEGIQVMRPFTECEREP